MNNYGELHADRSHPVRTYTELLAETAVRFLPSLLKSLFWDEDHERMRIYGTAASDNPRDLSRYLKTHGVTADMGKEWPVCQFYELSISSETELLQLLSDLSAAVDEAGISGNTSIVFVSEGGRNPAVFIRPSLYAAQRLSLEADPETGAYEETPALKLCDAPLALSTDYVPTVLSLGIGVDTGLTMMQIPDEERERRLVTYSYGEDNLYTGTGFRMLRRDSYLDGSVLDRKIHPRELEEMRMAGFWYAESGFIWTNGHHALLGFPVGEVTEDLEVQLSFWGYQTPQTVRVFADPDLAKAVSGAEEDWDAHKRMHAKAWLLSQTEEDLKKALRRGFDMEKSLDLFKITEPDTRTVRVPKEAVVDGVLCLRLYLPDAVSPAEAEGGTDTRELSMALTSVKISYAAPEVSVFP
ncbi:MAG: hypothetical protein K6E92_08255, partial [Lachnospiraceae bacterium]|nr:hypothetical protein [Lachnospiraceae bacterium]